MIHLEADGGLEGAERACVERVAKGMRSGRARDDGEQSESSGDSDDDCGACHGLVNSIFSLVKCSSRYQEMSISIRTCCRSLPIVSGV